MGDIKSLEAFRKMQGAKAHAFGSLFEQMFESMCKRNGVAVTRFPDGCKTIGPKKVIRVKTPFDWILTHRSRTALIDTKTSDTASFPHSKITNHQIHEMVHHEIAGGVAGYIIWLRKTNDILFVPSIELVNLAKHKGSIEKGQANTKYIGDAAYFDVRLIFSGHDDPKEFPNGA
jgi:penicillin-binding protein-related factor A (putative recombinase)